MSIIIVLLFVGVGWNALTMRRLRTSVRDEFTALGNLTIELHRLGRKKASDAVTESRITRGYLVELLEQRLLPHLGYKEPERSPEERRVLEMFRQAVDCYKSTADCGKEG
jgi:hypothetical protein